MRNRIPLKIVPYQIQGGRENMETDVELLECCECDPSHGYLRFYGWNCSTLSLGRFEKIEVIDRARASEDGIEIVRRPTGGRVVMHGDDLTYCVVIPLLEAIGFDEIYTKISVCLIKGLNHLGIDLGFERGKAIGWRLQAKPCFASAARYEIKWRGKKLVGSAQRVGKRAVLQHGSIPIGSGYLRVVDYMSCDDTQRVILRKTMKRTTCHLNKIAGRQVMATEVADAIIKGFDGSFRIV